MLWIESTGPRPIPLGEVNRHRKTESKLLDSQFYPSSVGNGKMGREGYVLTHEAQRNEGAKQG